jgi:hypothetical protein
MLTRARVTLAKVTPTRIQCAMVPRPHFARRPCGSARTCCTIDGQQIRSASGRADGSESVLASRWCCLFESEIYSGRQRHWKETEMNRSLVRAFRRCRPSSSLRCLVDIARYRRQAEPAGGRRRAGLVVGRGRAGPAQRPCCCWAGPRLPTRLLETVVNGGPGPRNLIPKSPAQITVLSSPK